MTKTGSVSSKDGLSLFYRTALVEKSHLTIVLIHGFAEHSGRYDHVIEAINHAKINVVAIDLRGHGYSAGKGGYIDSMQQYIDDVHVAVELAQNQCGSEKVVLMAHSMGALISTHYAAANEVKLKGLVMSCPLFGIKVKMPAWKTMLGNVMSHLYPSFSMPNTINAHDLTHDRDKAHEYMNDPLIFHYARARWFCEILKSQNEAHRIASRLRIPLLMQLSDQDRIVDTAQSQRWYERCMMSDKTQFIYPGFFHEIYNEVGRTQPITDLISWLKARWAKENSKLISVQGERRTGDYHDVI